MTRAPSVLSVYSFRLKIDFLTRQNLDSWPTENSLCLEMPTFQSHLILECQCNETTVCTVCDELEFFFMLCIATAELCIADRCFELAGNSGRWVS